MAKGRIAVIGGGISGMCAAIAARQCGADVTVFDSNASLGRKILKTGNGRCNFSNADLSASHYHSESPEHVKSVIGSFGLDKTLEFLKSCGIEPKCVNGLYYPYSMQAKAVRDCLVAELAILGIKMLTEKKVTGIRAFDGCIELQCAQGIYDFDACILACGGMADPESGSDGNGFVLAKSLGINVIRPLPALCPLVSDDVFLHKASGVRIDANVSITAGDKKYKESGNLQITEYGISGICTMQLSIHGAKALNDGLPVLAQLDLMPDKKQNEVKNILQERFRKLASSKSAISALYGVFPDKLIPALLKKSGIKVDAPASSVDEKSLKGLLLNIKGYSLNITDTKGFIHAQSTRGGVDLKEIDKKTLMAKAHKGVYFCGEILDVCGDCGGYNIQWAISSGAVAGGACGEGL